MSLDSSLLQQGNVNSRSGERTHFFWKVGLVLLELVLLFILLGSVVGIVILIRKYAPQDKDEGDDALKDGFNDISYYDNILSNSGQHGAIGTSVYWRIGFLFLLDIWFIALIYTLDERLYILGIVFIGLLAFPAVFIFIVLAAVNVDIVPVDLSKLSEKDIDSIDAAIANDPVSCIPVSSSLRDNKHHKGVTIEHDKILKESPQLLKEFRQDYLKRREAKLSEIISNDKKNNFIVKGLAWMTIAMFIIDVFTQSFRTKIRELFILYD
jgi:hypothetical protein